MILVDVLSGRVETLAGNPAGTERVLRAAVEHSKIADTWFYALISVDLARAACDQDRSVECLEILGKSERRPSPPDRELTVERLSTRALALGRLGQLKEAEDLAGEAVGTVEATELLNFHADALVVLAEVLHLAGKPEEAAAACEKAVALYEHKGNVVSAAKARATLADLSG
jgi:tetratricopeptide (TPR) repeat protein